ncbi:MAG: methionine biosynthesis protein MetW [Oceanicoccus sp.]|uniref:methionine biosynthesis protein MetW n=1 Tax=Oceanicoccus sp. TaxID=2691044 RepID=UPI0026145786|nr:methionine biosynthesis protein MetW [Oceanicoccus sp.]MCP3908103.1 methionine biosynthesis protein MetW [Oceanicoccus sp.]MDG1773794.1 methionine biosynthesis protein MetW [Oceanicoccus sp.]
MRFDLQVIPHWIKPGSRVLDLGCGDGELLKKLEADKQVDGLGIEIDADKITACIAKRLNIVEQDLNKGLANFQDDSFDIVVMAHALQTLHDPHVVIDEMLRVGKECIVTFPNFAHWSCRLHLGSQGRMPVSKFMPYNWYDTPNIHFCTVKDFEALCAENNIKVLATTVVSHDSSESFLGTLLPNLFGVTAVYHISR